MNTRAFDVAPVPTSFGSGRRTRGQLPLGQDDWSVSKQKVSARYVQHSIFGEVFESLVRDIDNKAKNDTKHFSKLVSGYPNAGKSTMVGKLVERYPKVTDGATIDLVDGTTAVCDLVPLVAIGCPSTPTEKAIISLMLRELGDPMYGRRALQNAREALKSFLYAAGTVAIVVDEAQRATDRHGKITQVNIATLYQTLHDQGIVVVLVGLARAKALMIGDSQVIRRWALPLRLSQYEWGSLALRDDDPRPRSRLLFIGMLTGIVSAVTLSWSNELNFRNEATAFRFYYASRGLVGYLKDLIVAAVDVAEIRKTKVIDLNILASAFERVLQTDGLQNPFLPSFEPALPPAPPDDSEILYPETSAGGSDTAKKRRAKLTGMLTRG